MDLDTFFDGMMGAMRNTRTVYHLTLGELIDALQSTKDSAQVEIDRGGFPGDFKSYRGYYADLAVDICPDPVSVCEFLAKAEAAVGQTFIGYKGGDFVMDEDTPLWVSPYGIASGMAIVAAEMSDDRFVLKTKETE
jgi:hypothetical protein